MYMGVVVKGLSAQSIEAFGHTLLASAQSCWKSAVRDICISPGGGGLV